MISGYEPVGAEEFFHFPSFGVGLIATLSSYHPSFENGSARLF